MIPKIIHYCWIKDNPYPDMVQKCIDSWKKYLPDYEFKRWGEQNFDMNSAPYVAQAYSQEKWAFVADYIRIWALKNYGGIYLDTDVEVLKPFDDLLDREAFTCFEHHSTENYPVLEAAVLGSVKGGEWINNMFEYFSDKDFINSKGIMDVTPLPHPLAVKTRELYDIKFNNEQQHFSGLSVYPCDYFSPKSNQNFEIFKTENTYAVHHFNGSWLPKSMEKLTVYVKKYGFWGKVLCCIIHPVESIRYMKYKRKHKHIVYK